MKQPILFFLVWLALSLSGPACADDSAPQEAANAAVSVEALAPADAATNGSQKPTAESKPTRPAVPQISQPDMSGGIIQVTFGLFIVLLIIAGAAWLTRRFGQFHSAAGGALRIVGGLHLGARERVVVVQVGDQQLLLGVAPGRVTALHVLAKPLNHSDASLLRPGDSFLDKLNTVLKRPGK